MKIKSLRGLLVVLAAALILAACATVPRPVHEEPLRLLADRNSTLLSINPQIDERLSRALLERFMEAEDAERFLHRTEMLDIILRAGTAGRMQFSLLGKGDYPRRLTNFAFGSDEQWVKRREPLVWWEHRRAELQIAVIPGGYILVSDGGIRSDMERLFQGSAAELPAEVRERRMRTAVSLYAPRPGELLDQLVSGDESRVDFSAITAIQAELSPDDEGFEASGSFALDNAEKGRAFALGFRLLLITDARSKGPEKVKRIIGRTEVKHRGRSVQFSGIPISLSEIEALLDSAAHLPQSQATEVAGEEG
jgi:hypothetical protein